MLVTNKFAKVQRPLAKWKLAWRTCMCFQRVYARRRLTCHCSYTGATIDVGLNARILAHSIHGSRQFMIKKRILCDHCRGTGAASSNDIHTCPGCNGAGVKIVRQQIFPGMVTQAQVTCNECGGRGQIIKRKCPHCGGNKVVDHTQHYTLEVPLGAPEGHEIVYEGEADESPDWEAGDVVLRLRSRREQGGWRRKESGLYWKETIGVEEARVTLVFGDTFLTRFQ